MKHYSLLILFIISSVCAFSQSELTIFPNNLDFELKNRDFHIEEVSDKRFSKGDLGYVFNEEGETIGIDFDRDLEKAFEFIFRRNISPTSQTKGFNIHINTLKIEEKKTDENISISVDLKVTYLKNLEIVHESQTSLKISKLGVEVNYSKFIQKALVDVLQDFQQNYNFSQSATKNNEADKDMNAYRADISNNVFAIGYQIGGYSLVGFDYTARSDDHFGIHGGLGFIGATFGVKYHFSKLKKSSFLNASYKFGGLLTFQSVNLEFGDRILFRQGKDFAFHYQLGVGVPVIDRDNYLGLNRDLHTEGNIDFLLSIGAGFSW